MGSVRDKVAVVTGAGSGTGRQLALELGRRGARLAISDVDEDGLAGTADEARSGGAEVHTARVDVADRQAVQEHAASGRGAPRRGAPDRQQRRRRELGLDPRRRVVRVGPRAGDQPRRRHPRDQGVPPPPQVHRDAARRAARSRPTGAGDGGAPGRGEDEHRHRRLRAGQAAAGRDRGRRGADAHLHEKLLTLPADRAAKIVVDGVEAGKARILVGNDAKAVDAFVRLVPRFYPALLVRFGGKVLGSAG